MSKEMNLEAFIIKYKEDALKLDLEKDVPITANKIYSQRIHLLENAEFESEVKEVLEVAEKAVIDFKKLLITCIQNNHYKANYIDHVPHFIEHLRFYLEYKELYKNAILKADSFSKPKFQFENKFDSVPEEIVYKYFYENLVDKRMLTENEFHEYLKLAFEQQKEPERKFILKGSPTKGRIRKIFNKYSKEVASRSDGELKKYAELLGTYFEGHENNSTLYTNFNK